MSTLSFTDMCSLLDIDPHAADEELPQFVRDLKQKNAGSGLTTAGPPDVGVKYSPPRIQDFGEAAHTSPARDLPPAPVNTVVAEAAIDAKVSEIEAVRRSLESGIICDAVKQVSASGTFPCALQ